MPYLDLVLTYVLKIGTEVLVGPNFYQKKQLKVNIVDLSIKRYVLLGMQSIMERARI